MAVSRWGPSLPQVTEDFFAGDVQPVLSGGPGVAGTLPDIHPALTEALVDRVLGAYKCMPATQYILRDEALIIFAPDDIPIC